MLCLRWYCKYGISYRDLAEMMQGRGIEVDPSTIVRRVQRYAPELEKRVRLYLGHRSGSWRTAKIDRRSPSHQSALRSRRLKIGVGGFVMLIPSDCNGAPIQDLSDTIRTR